MSALRRTLIAFAALASVLPAAAADLGAGEGGLRCVGGLHSSLPADPGRDDVARLIDEAVAASQDPRWVNSGRPVFVWATEAKAACGKASGYLQSGVHDEQTLGKCGCFHARMVSYMD